MRHAAITGLVAMLALAGAGGCARNAVTVERGGQLASVGMPVTNAARAVVRDVQAVNREAVIAIAVADPKCDWRDIRIETAEPPPEGTLICGFGDSTVPFTVLDAAAVRPTLALIDALVAYLSAVDDIVSAAPDDSGAMLEMALVDVNAVLALAGDAGVGSGTPALNKEQISAAGALAGLIGAVVRERDQVARLRLLQRQAADVPAIIAALDRDLQGWTKWSTPASLRAIDTAYELRSLRQRRAMQGQTAAERTLAAEDQWRQFLTQWAAVRDRQAASAALPVEMQKAMAALRVAQQDYARILDSEATLNAADRAAMARTARVRLRQAMSAVAGALRAFV